MALHPLAGKPAPADILIDPARLEAEYYANSPDPADPNQRVSFGTSGHRGATANSSFTEAHILAITQAICDFRAAHNVSGPLFLGKDTHALSHAAQRTALEVLAANDLPTVIQKDDLPTPTPVISRAILRHNRPAPAALADGIVISPSHNPPADGGFKYNPTHGGPAGSGVTSWIQNRANELLAAGNSQVHRIPYQRALKAPATQHHDYVPAYVEDLALVLDLETVASESVKLGVDPLGGASQHYWHAIAAHYNLNLENVNPRTDPTFSFMTCDHDGQIRMDCSSPYAMASLVALKDRFDVAFGADPDADRHGIVVPGAGLLNPNHYLAVAIRYLLTHRPDWPVNAAVGKTLVSSSIIDRVVAHLKRPLAEVPVGFKWFSDGLATGTFCFGGEESAGASFLERNGQAWTTDKDGILLNLLAAEITAVTGRNPAQHYAEITNQFGAPSYTRIDVPCTPEQKKRLTALDASKIHGQLAGDPISSVLTHAPANNAAIGGLKVVSPNGWFAARPSGTENIYKIYAESFRGARHLEAIVSQAQTIVTAAVS